MSPRHIPYVALSKTLAKAQVGDASTRNHLVAYLKQQGNLQHDEWGRLPNQMFWPPRVVNGINKSSLNIFFGSGISLAAGIPDWTTLLRQVGVDPEVEKDPNATGDLLTLAELAAHAVGADPLQSNIRRALSKVREPTTAHILLAALHLPLYLTTNYDCLLENALRETLGVEARVITNDLNVREHLGESAREWDEALCGPDAAGVVIKLHGSVAREGEHMILTRSDYRRHYRSNPLMLKLVRHVLGTRHTLFLGFSHRDPEVARIIEDVIFEAESHEPESHQPVSTIPGFYSLQFHMLQKTPEVFAARGIVALQPSLVLPSERDIDPRGCALAQGLVDLVENADEELDKALTLDDDLRRISGAVSQELRQILILLKTRENDARAALKTGDKAAADLVTSAIVKDLQIFANQGAYLADQHGQLISAAAPQGIDADRRRQVLRNVQHRPYFRIAQSNRNAFVSDLFESRFNGNATVAACLPLLEADRFKGLVFVAFQLDDGGLVRRVRAIATPTGASMLVMDANGLLVIPPEREIELRTPAVEELSIPGEDPASNRGFRYGEVLQTSRRDKRIDRLMQNVVPLAQDDDVQMLASDIVSYSVITELAEARWKVALTRYLRIRAVDDT